MSGLIRAGWRALVLTGLGLAITAPALSHGPGPEAGPVGPVAWAGNWLFWFLVLTGLTYGLGLLRSRRRPAWWKPVLFALAWGLGFIALFGALAAWAHASVAGHMAQHMMLLAVMPPLVLLARPLPQFLRALPARLRRLTGPLAARIYSAAGRTPVSAFVVHGVIIWLWHMPSPLQVTIEHRLLHDMVHLVFLAAGLWFWWSLMAPVRLGRAGFGPAILLAVLTLMHTGMLGALLTFAPQLLYPDHPAGFAGFSALSDQQLAGLIMWVPGGLIYAVAALWLAALWLRQTERSSPADSELNHQEIP